MAKKTEEIKEPKTSITLRATKEIAGHERTFSVELQGKDFMEAANAWAKRYEASEV